MANDTASMENVAKTTLWQSNESSYLKGNCGLCLLLNGSFRSVYIERNRIRFGIGIFCTDFHSEVAFA